MAQYCGELNTNLMIGVGAALDIHAGFIKGAPKRIVGLEWLFRVIQEPHRQWKRYLTCVPAFIWNVNLQLLSPRRFEING